ncbi:hypothetical protein ZOSMA_140G00210 [Zostera marina]|uniref:DUF630 domain-containing protein n=1 Tax=Zostera marina TaxID=29655 RepID=A0A0K9PXK6_ZOSMR|nr:hypothetical protein ZOSMA_140G00210 [Zostera marina]
MGATISKVDQDKALLLCRERRSHVRQALDGRCSLAEAHTAYIQALANMGMALGKVVDSESPNDSSLYNFTSTSGTHYPNTCTDKSVSQISNSCPSPSQQSDTLCSFSPTASRLHVNCMRSSTDFSTTFEEKPPVSVTATLTPSPNLHETPWDYFVSSTQLMTDFLCTMEGRPPPMFQTFRTVSIISDGLGKRRVFQIWKRNLINRPLMENPTTSTRKTMISINLLPRLWFRFTKTGPRHWIWNRSMEN